MNATDITIHHFTWDDTPALVDLMRAAAEADDVDRTMSPQEFHREFGGPLAQPTRDILLARHQGRIVAAAWAWMEGRETDPHAAMLLLLHVHPDYRDRRVGERLVDLALAQGHALGAATARGPARPQEPYKRDLWLAKGFAFSRSWYLMRARLPETLDANSPPAGFHVHTYHGDQDDESLIALINDIFATAYLDRTYAVADMCHWVDDAEFDPDLLEFLTAEDGTLAGYVWSWGDPSPGEGEERVGFIGDLGVRAAYRGQGLGRWLLQRAMADLRARGMRWVDLEMDGTNTQARRLYASEGFQVREQVHWYEQGLRDDAHA